MGVGRYVLGIVLVLIIAGCESSGDFWDTETCYNRLEGDVEDLFEYQGKYEEALESLDYYARSGQSEERTEGFRRSAEGWKRNMEDRIVFIDGELTDLCKTLNPTLLSEVDKIRAYLAEEKPEVEKPEQEKWPDVKVVDIQSEFIPYEIDENGKCSGPYLDLLFTIKNEGGDYPRPIDLKTTLERTQDDHETLKMLTIKFETEKNRGAVSIDRTKLADDKLAADATYQIPVKYRVSDDEMTATFSATVGGAYFMKPTEDGDSVPFIKTITIPIWDIHTESTTTIPKEYEDGSRDLSAQATIINRGVTPTPGPVYGSFQWKKDGKLLASMKGTTGGPVGASSTITESEIKLKNELGSDFIVHSSIRLLCPDGESGSLSDGVKEGNIRDLRN